MKPSRRTIVVLWAWIALSLWCSFVPSLLWGFGTVGLIVFVLLSIDAIGALGKVPVEVERIVPSSIALGIKTDVVLRFTVRGEKCVRIIAHDNYPPSFIAEGLPRVIEVKEGSSTEVPYKLRSLRRGAFEFRGTVFLLASPLGFFWRKVVAGNPQAVSVYPNFRAVARYALLATDNRLSQLGIRQRQRRGQGLEFHQLREYRVGDMLRQIDWRATSKLLKLISREYRDERDQQVMLMLDCGRRMHGDDLELTLLDHALDATLLLAYVALRQGDAVGLMTFGGQERCLLPYKGTAYLNTLLNASYDLMTTTAASDTGGAMEEALKRLKRRSLIVLVSNIGEGEDRELIDIMRVAQRRHLVLLASMRQKSLRLALEADIEDFDTALRKAATGHYLKGREDAHKKLQDAGVMCLDSEPSALSFSLVNRYLDIKAGGML